MSSLPQMPAAMPALTPALPDEPPGRAIDDPALVRRAIFDKALTTVQELPPVVSSTHTLRLRNAGYEGPDNVGMREYKRALLSGDTLARRLRADVDLVDNATGSVLDTRRTTLAAIPYYTDAGVFINKGTKYAMANQQRLRAGAYTRTRDNGEVETHINVPPGQGAPFRVFLDPATGVFKARVGQAQIPLVPMLQSLGVTEQDMRNAWGAKLTTANIAKVRGGDLQKLYTRLVRTGKSQTEPEQMAEIRQLLENTRLDPDVMRHTLKKPIERVDADTLLTTTRKLLAIHNRKNPELLKELGLEPEDQDDRDHLAFMRLLGPEDITAERLRTAPKILRPLLWKAGRTGRLDHVAPGVLTRLVQDAILGSGLGQATEDINPLQVFEQQLRVTRMGVGGIPSDDSVPDSSRSVQPSHAGYIDPIVTPESSRAGIDVRLSRQTRKGNDGELYSKFYDMRTGTEAWKQPKELFDSVIAFSSARLPSPERPFSTADYVKFRNALDRGEIVQSKSGKYFAQGMQRGQLDYYPLNQVDYAIPNMENSFSPTANLVPGKSGMKGQRVAMGARMLTQALPLVDAEAPLVQSGVPGEAGSFEGLYGARMGALKATQGGRVLGVGEDSITVQYDDGRKDEIELARYVPGARKTYTHQEAVVTPGARFEPGQLLARSNFTDKNGTAALGRNLRTAWMPLKGYNYEDAVVLSESGAKKLTSQHMYKTSVDVDKDSDKIGLAPYRGMFPKRFTAAQLEKVDEHGVVRVGQRVESGDPLVLMANERRGRVGEVSRAGASRWRDAAETWEHDQPGIVTDVAKTKNGVVVAVKSVVPMQVGDKLANRFGSKGVVAAILPDDEMPRNEAGEPIELAVNDLGITTRTNPIQAVEAVLGKVALKRGEPYNLHDFNNIADLRAFAMKEAERYGVKGAEDLLDPETGKAIPRVMTGQHFIMKLHHVAESKVSGRSFGAYTADAVPAKGGPEGAKTWGMLHLNALLSHGAVDVAKDGHMVRGQRNPQYWAAVMAGKTPPDPPVPPVYRKFVAQLQAAGIHPVREGTRTHLMAMTNATIGELAGDREVTSPDTVDWNDDGMKPIRGGLFDEGLFGGVDGCFHPSVTVWTERGPLPIGQIVQQRLAVRVQTYNFQSQRFELKPITNWFQNCSREGIGRAVFADGVAGRLAGRHTRYNPTTLWGTRGHQVYDGGGQKHDLAAATQLTFAVESLSYTQEQLIYGTLLGDGHVRPDGLYDASHSMRQAGYLRLKHAILRPLCDNPPVEFLDTSGGLSRRKIRFLTKAHDALRQARNLCYVGQRKTLSAEWLAKVDEMGLAFWFFDDGSVHRNRGKNTVYVKFCTECFSSVEVQLLQGWLAARWGLSDSYLARDAGRYEDRDCGWQICLAGDNAWQLLTLVAPYAEQSVRYKFPVRPRMASCACGSEIAPAATYCNRCLLTAAAACGPGKLPRTVRDRFGGSAAARTLLNTGTVPPTTLPLAAWQAVRDALGCAVAKMQTDTELRLSLREEPVQFLWQTGARWERTRTVYDIEVADNHNYFANGVLVSNSRWAKITLPEPLPNPVMEEPIRRVLGLTGPQFERIIAGQEQLNGDTGSRAIATALGNINVDAEIERAAREIRGTRKTARDAATRRVGFLLGARKTGVQPKDWMWNSVPVMPPRWRPVSRMQGTDAPMVADANYLYRDLFENKRNLEQLQGQVSDVGDERLALYQSMRAVTGLGDPAPEHLKEQKIKGAMQHIIGSSPKHGVVQRRLLGSQTDLVGRGTIVPNPDLDMDQVGIPEDQAWQVYRPFVVRHMAKRGVPPGRAAEMVANRNDVARRALTDVMAERPVLLDRAPVLHRFGVMAFWPRIAKGNQIELTPIVTKGFGADFDGDAMQFHVPGSDKAVTDAVEKMMPSSNLRAPADFKVHQLPQQEYLAGLYRATHDRKNAAPVQFPTMKAMLAALSRGDISHDQPVVIEES